MAPSWYGQHNGQVKLGGPGHWWATNAFDYSLDVITLLAVIGEQSMADHSQVINVHWSCYLPRLLPAPQAFLKPNRPNSLPHIKTTVIGVSNGSTFDSISLFADSLLQQSVHDLPKYTFRIIRITHREKAKHKEEENGHKSDTKPQEGENGDQIYTKPPPEGYDSLCDELSDEIDDILKPPEESPQTTSGDNLEDIGLTANYHSPLVWLSFISFMMSFGILIGAIVIHDGMGVIAISILSLASSLIGFASKWQPKLTVLPPKKKSTDLPSSDIILHTRAGAFVLVKCTEHVARELFAGTHECQYQIRSTKLYRVLMSIATVFIMVSVIFLGNCRWEIKAVIGGCYILLNLFYWVADMYKPKIFWDLKRYETKFLPGSEMDWREFARKDFAQKKLANPSQPYTTDDVNELKQSLQDVCDWVNNDEDECFTRAVWQTIYSSGSTEWAKKVLPKHKGWDLWLEKAKEIVAKGERNWKAVNAKNLAFKEVADAEILKKETDAGRPAMNTNVSGSKTLTDVPMDVDSKSQG